MNWEAIDKLIDEGKETFSSLYQKALAKVPGIQVDPKAYEKEFQVFVDDMKTMKATLNQIKPMIRTPQDVARFNRINARYTGLKDQFMKDAKSLEAVPLLAYGLISAGAAAIAWAAAMRPYATGYRIQAQAVLEDLRAREAASKEGRTLAPATVEKPEAPKIPEIGGYIVPGILGALAIGGIVWYVTKRS